MTRQQQIIEESMLAQRAYLEIVRSRHYQWAYASEDAEIQRLHLEIAESIEAVMNQYYELINVYHMVPSSLSPIRADIFTLYPTPVSNSADA